MNGKALKANDLSSCESFSATTFQSTCDPAPWSLGVQKKCVHSNNMIITQVFSKILINIIFSVM